MKYLNEDKAAEQKFKQSATQPESSLLAPTAEQLKAEATADQISIPEIIDGSFPIFAYTKVLNH